MLPTKPASQPDPGPARHVASSAGNIARPRLVPGGYDITRLPLTVDPGEGEQLASWLVRWAHRFGLPVSQLLSALGVGLPAAPSTRVEHHLAAHADTLAAAAGLRALPPSRRDPSSAVASEMLLARYLTDYHGRSTPLLPRSRFCPRCLAESGGIWLTQWTGPLELVCTRHQVLLARRCPACHRARFTTTAWMTHNTDPWVCSESIGAEHVPRTRYEECGQDLRLTPTIDVDDTTTQLQHWLRSLAEAAARDPDGSAQAGGFDVTHRDLFDALLELIVEGLGRTGHLTQPGRDPRPLLIALRVARAVLEQPDAAASGALADAHGLLSPAGPITPIAPDYLLTRRRRNSLLTAIRMASLHEHLSPSSQLVFRTGSGHPRYPAAPKPGEKAPGQTQLAWIPQQLWPGLLTPWIADDDYRDRAAAAMLLAKAGSTRSWRLIAIDLGLPASFAVHPPNLVRHLVREGSWPDVLGRLDEIATALEASPPPIDYQARRWLAADQGLIVTAVNRTRLTLGPVHGWVSTHLLAELFWHVYTGGDLRLAAPSQGTLLNPDLYHDDEGVFAGPVTDPDLLTFLTATAAQVDHVHDRDMSEPLTWQPP